MSLQRPARNKIRPGGRCRRRKDLVCVYPRRCCSARPKREGVYIPYIYLYVLRRNQSPCQAADIYTRDVRPRRCIRGPQRKRDDSDSNLYASYYTFAFAGSPDAVHCISASCEARLEKLRYGNMMNVNRDRQIRGKKRNKNSAKVCALHVLTRYKRRGAPGPLVSSRII